MKYYVQANRHYLVTVDADSALCAEHMLLDLDGIQYSNAFDAEGRRTDTFRGALLDCVTVSMEELERTSEMYSDAVKALQEAKQSEEMVARHLERLRKQLADIEKLYTEAQEYRKVRERELFWAKVGIGLEEVPEEYRDRVG